LIWSTPGPAATLIGTVGSEEKAKVQFFEHAGRLVAGLFFLTGGRDEARQV
jgi:hypothetical protein